MDAFDSTEPYSRIYIYNERALNLWTFNQHDFVIPSLCLWHDPATPGRRVFVALSENGQVILLAPQLMYEQIPDAGLNQDWSKGFGYLNDIQQIGNHLYACGFSGQVYRRNGGNDWVHMDKGILQQPGMRGGEYFAQVINGPNERAIYVAGSENLPGHPARSDFWNGDEWARLPLPRVTGRITGIYVESEDQIWMCGAKGTVLKGNAKDGFTIVTQGGPQLFLSLCKFQDKLYLASNIGLFTYDPANPTEGVRKVWTQMDPELQDANVVERVDEILWSIGPKDIVRFDGVKWQRIHHPDNPQIGGVQETG
jgi:hypothetical protein